MKRRRDRLFLAGAVLIAAVYAFFVLLLPARGMTFYWDDWLILDRLAREPRPASWFVPHNQHWAPVAFALIDLEHALFGARHFLYLGVLWALHVGDVLLLALLLRAHTQDARAAAIAAALFGTASIWREALWFVTDTPIVLCFFFTLAGFLATARDREEPRLRWKIAACAAIPLAAMSWGGGIALGPALALEASALAPGGERFRRALPAAATWSAFALLYTFVAGRSAGGFLAKTPEQLRGAWLFLVEVIGLGFALGYAALVALAAFTLPDKERKRLLLVHAWLALLLLPMALTRWYHNDREHNPLAAASRYQYLPALAWTTLVALLLRQRSRPVFGAAALAVLLLAIGHARAAREDRGAFAPWGWRQHGGEWVRALEQAARSGRGPLYDARPPAYVADPREMTASRMVPVIAPDAAPVWTSTRSPETDWLTAR